VTRLIPLLLLTGCCYAPPSYQGLNLTEAQRKALPYVNIPSPPPTIYVYPARPAPIWGPDR